MKRFWADKRVRVAAGALAVVCALAAWVRMGPLPDGLLDLDRRQSTVLLDRHGEVLYESRGVGGGRSAHLSADALPSTLVAATIAAEDHRFYRHAGVDPLAIVRALYHDLRQRRIVEGGSTITQQVAKLLLAQGAGGGRRGLVEKVHETVIALRLEHRLSKSEILALYLNLASYGNQLVGAQRASQEYFGVGSELLTPAQAAFLAALPQRPSTFNPYRSPAAARARQQYVLARLAATGAISAAQAAEAAEERLSLEKEPAAFLAPHFVQHVLAHLPPGRTGRITTTIDAGLQRDVEGIIRSQRPTLDKHGAHNVAVVVLDNTTGEWLAWEGSGDYQSRRYGGAIDGVVALRQPGSALKPFTYALAFEQGETPATVLADVPSYFPTAEEGVLYSPQNYDGQFRGPLLARRALAGSENVPAVALASNLGVPNLLRFLRRAGFSSFDKTATHYGLGVTLGNAEVRLDELVAAYAMLARGGLPIAPSSVRAAGSSTRAEAVALPERLVSTRTAFWITDILADSNARAYVFGRGSALDFPFAVAAKTGTSQAYHDNWAIGYTKAITVGVWVGNFDRTPLVGSSGVTGAGPIFHAVMLAAERHVAGEFPHDGDTPGAAAADGLELRSICTLSGKRAGPSCPTQTQEWLPIDGGIEDCGWHRTTGATVAVVWPAEYRAWAAERGLVTPAADLAVRSDAVRTSGESPARALTILNPPAEAIYLIDPTLRREFQSLSLRATSPAGGSISWTIDGQALGTSGDGKAFEWPLAAGRHRIVASDRRGQQATVSIVVK